jgi:hypothetical protein
MLIKKIKSMRVLIIASCLLYLTSCINTNNNHISQKTADMNGVKNTGTPIPLNQNLSDLSTDQFAENRMGMVESKNGISVRLDWFYADPYRVSFEYAVEGIVLPDGYYLYCPLSTAELTDHLGNEYPAYRLYQQDDSQITSYCIWDAENQVYRFLLNYLNNPQADQPDSIFEVDLTLGGLDAYSHEQAPISIPDYGNFHFSVNSSIGKGLTFFPDQTKTANGLAVNLNRVEVGQQFKSLELCVNYENQQGWQPEVFWKQNGNNIPYVHLINVGLENKEPTSWVDRFETRRCYRIVFINEGIPQDNIQVLFDYLAVDPKAAMTDEDCLSVQSEIKSVYPGLTFRCDYHYKGLNYGLNLIIDQMPEGMELVTANEIVEQAFIQKIPADFLFEFPLP